MSKGPWIDCGLLEEECKAKGTCIGHEYNPPKLNRDEKLEKQIDELVEMIRLSDKTGFVIHPELKVISPYHGKFQLKKLMYAYAEAYCNEVIGEDIKPDSAWDLQVNGMEAINIILQDMRTVNNKRKGGYE